VVGKGYWGKVFIPDKWLVGEKRKTAWEVGRHQGKGTEPGSERPLPGKKVSSAGENDPLVGRANSVGGKGV